MPEGPPSLRHIYCYFKINPLFSLSLSTSDAISTAAEFGRIFTGDEAITISLMNRLGWFGVNSAIPGRIPSAYPGREQLQPSLIKNATEEIENLSNQ